MRNPSRDVCENGALELLRTRERRAVDEEVEAAEFLVEAAAELGDLIVARHVARQNQRILQRRRELAHVALRAARWDTSVPAARPAFASA